MTIMWLRDIGQGFGISALSDNVLDLVSLHLYI